MSQPERRSLLPRLRRLREKAGLRLRLAWGCLTEFEDTVPRSILKFSFAQNGEDLIVWHALYDLGIARPRYLDIGAHDPVRLSNTALFYLLGGDGMNIEPDPVLFQKFLRHRRRDINLNIGIAPQAGELTFFRMADPSLSTFSASEAERMQRDEGIALAARLRIPVDNINAVLDRRDFTPDFLSVDTEGNDLIILQSYDFSRRRPAVVCVETISFSTHGEGRKNPAIADYLSSRGYRVHADTAINTIFVDTQRDRRPA
jgi:FkbM family methyltransferase